MKIENSFSVPVDKEKAMDILTNVPMIAPCIPGAELTAIATDGVYRGALKMRLGPVTLTFGGEARIIEIDRAAGTATLHTKGADNKGRGGAEARTAFRLAEDAGQTWVEMQTDLTLSGSVAQYGRAAGLISDVAKQFTQQFADNLRRQLMVQHPEAVALLERSSAPADGKQAVKPISGFALIVQSLRAMLRRWFGLAARP
ncbi:MAG: SRPBCC family protein [Gammaproteobacteria bacterium]|nr:SRPBCC family protein [Gammaproteobacteria bacterium]MDH3410956.1 SRPBCC family protein [Gammaproteobacteria bacterium]